MLASSHGLFLSQVIAHIGLTVLVFYGNVWQWQLCFLVYFLTGCLGMSITFHRQLSHNAFNPKKWFFYAGSFLGVLGLVGSPIAWVAIHREHHRYTDKSKDPHSPNTSSWFKVQFLSMYHRPKLVFVKDLLKVRWLVFLHKYYFLIHIVILFLLYIIDPLSVCYLYLAPAAILWHGGSLVNNLGHMFGYRNFATNDCSVNNLLLGYLMWGEGWHNNHHSDPKRKCFGKRPWELDISYGIMLLVESSSKESKVRTKI